MKTLSSLILFFSLSLFTFAEVVPWMVITGRGATAPTGTPSSYTVPAGKVFIVESVQHRGVIVEGNDWQVSVRQKPANFSDNISYFIDVGTFKPWKVNPLAKPLRLAAGDRLGSNQVNGYTLWWGVLADASDLFASLDVELKDSQVEGDKLKALAKVSPTRPHRLTVETADELSDFSPEPNATITSTDKSTEKDVAVYMEATCLKFLRVEAVARPNHLR